MGRWWPVTSGAQPSGASPRPHNPPKRPASGSNTARSAPSSCVKGALARDAQLGDPTRQRLRPKRTAVVSHYTEPPEGSTTVCTDELGPGVLRTFDPAPGWSATGHRLKAPMDYGRGPEKTWVYGALRVRNRKEVTRCATSRNAVMLHRPARRQWTIQPATSTSFPLNSRATTASRPAAGWQSIHA